MWTPRRHSSQTSLKEQTQRHSLTDRKPSAVTRCPESHQSNDEKVTPFKKLKKRDDQIQLKSQKGTMKFKVYRDKDVGLQGYSQILIGQDQDDDCMTTSQVLLCAKEMCVQDLEDALGREQQEPEQESISSKQ